MKRKLTLLSIVLTIGIHCFASTDTLRVLAIGNSFSEDAVENYLHDLGKADGVTFIIGNMMIGGCSLETHRNNAVNDLARYSYRKIEADGEKRVVQNARLADVIPSEPWDYISFQQVSDKSGIYDTFFPYLTELLDYTKERVTNPDVKYAFHMTWAYAQNSTHAGFANYGRDQSRMYRAIVDAVGRVAETAGMDIVIPTGKAIQNARSSQLGDTLCRDGYHLDLTVGRFVAACTWYATLSGRCVSGNGFAPESLSESEISIARRSADDAIEN